LINLIAEVDDILKLHIDQSKNTMFTGLSKTIQNELLDSILAVAQDLIQKEIAQSDYIAIAADETTGISVHE
jgi:hemerythrin-like domain-containing protein